MRRRCCLRHGDLDFSGERARRMANNVAGEQLPAEEQSRGRHRAFPEQRLQPGDLRRSERRGAALLVTAAQRMIPAGVPAASGYSQPRPTRARSAGGTEGFDVDGLRLIRPEELAKRRSAAGARVKSRGEVRATAAEKGRWRDLLLQEVLLLLQRQLRICLCVSGRALEPRPGLSASLPFHPCQPCCGGARLENRCYRRAAALGSVRQEERR